MRFCLAVFTLFIHVFGGHSLIVPDEIPTILSVIYSNIPIIKKGTDSRIGWGFRLGNRADFQVLVELGPQTYTQPLANQGDSGTSKRNSPNTLQNTLYAQRQKEKQISNTEGGKWLETWSKNAQKQQEIDDVSSEPRPGIAIGEIDAKSVIPDDSAVKLAELFKEKNEKVDDPVAKLTELYGKEEEAETATGKSETTVENAD